MVVFKLVDTIHWHHHVVMEKAMHHFSCHSPLKCRKYKQFHTSNNQWSVVQNIYAYCGTDR